MSENIERMWDQIAHDLGQRDCNMRRDRPYTGQPHTDTGARGATEIKGITFRDLRDCFIRAILQSTGGQYYDGDEQTKARMKALYDEAEKGENAALCSDDLYGFDLDKLDPIAIVQNLSCEVERVMGIFPNIDGTTFYPVYGTDSE